MVTRVIEKVKTDVLKLREALVKIGQAVPLRTILPICTHVAIESKDGVMTLKATNLESTVITSIKADGEFQGCLPYRLLSTFISKGNGEISFSGDGMIDRPKIGRMRVKKESIKDFPPIPEANVPIHILEAKEFCRMLNIVTTACCREESRPVLTGVSFQNGAIAAADGFRLYVYQDEKLQFGLNVNQDAIIPFRTTFLVSKIFGKSEKLEVGFDIPHSLVKFQSGETSIISRLITGSFPRYTQLIPQTFQVKASFSAPLMMDRLNSVRENEIGGGILRLYFEKTELHEDVCIITASEGNELEYEFGLPCKILSPTLGKIGVNIQYLKDAVKYFSMVDIALTSPSSPMKITGDIEGLTIVTMPMFVEFHR